ncbi:MAG: glyoxalase family protein [Thermoleophilaceae bacterium]|jgi:glyoxalase family protein|nr:glyoxalase family protein [Thermoleophilaceae bacterium]
MQLDGIHHVTAITGDAPRNVDFYTRVLGLRMVKKTVNQDDPSVYHLFYADERGSAGSDITFFEYPGAAPGTAGAGMVERVAWRVGSPDALDFWTERLGGEGVQAAREDDAIRFADPEGLGLELRVVHNDDEPLVAHNSEIPAELALQGFDGVRALTDDPDKSRPLLEGTLGFTPTGDDAFEVRGPKRGSFYAYQRTVQRGVQGAGTVHHVAFASQMDEHDAWRQQVAESGQAHPTPVIDRFYFRSIYFREPSGVLFEIATLGPGFATDEDPDHLGERLSLPPAFEHLRDRVEQALTPLPVPAGRG